MTKVQPPAPPYLGPAKFHGGPQNLAPLKRIVIHGTVSPCVAGGARATAAYFKNTVTRPSSAHYVVDPAEVVQVVGDHQIAYHAPPNTDTIGVEHCDPVAGPATRWQDSDHEAMLDRSAKLVAQLCLAYDVPIRRVGPVGLRLGRRGITGHGAVSLAWRQTTHTDPGKDFPWTAYIARVKAAAAELIAGPPSPPAQPIPVVVPAKPSAPELVRPSLTVVTSNIKNNPDLSREHVLHDTRAVSRLGGVVLWQEIAEADDRADLQTSLPPGAWTHVGLEDECPISLFTGNWNVHRTGSILLHGGKAAVSPHRVARWAEVSRKGSAQLPFVLLNTHWVSGAFSHAGQAAEDWRVEMWNRAHDKASALVQQFLAEDLTVIGGGDYNRTGEWPGFAPQHRWLLHGGFDHLWTCEAERGTQVHLTSAGTLGLDELYTDHPARWVHLGLSASKLTGKVHS